MSDATSHEVQDIEIEEDVALEGVSPSVIRSGLESDEPLVRVHAAKVAEAVAAGDVDAVLAVLPTVIDRLGDDRRVVVTKSTIVTSIVAREHPEELEPAVGRLVELLSHDLDLVRVLAAKTLGPVAVEYPDYLLGHEAELIDAIVIEHREDVIDRRTLAEETDSQTNFEVINQHNIDADARQTKSREAAANLLVEVAKGEPDRLVEQTDRIAEALDDPSAQVVTACLEILGRIARVDRSPVLERADAIRDHLEDPAGASVASAVATLGYARDPAAIEPLREIAADEDRDEDVRELADETAEFIEQSNT